MELGLNTTPTATDSANTINEASHRFHERQQALSLIKQLSHLTQAIQLHRGLGMSLIAGYQEFETDFVNLQAQVDRRMRVLAAMAAEFDEMLTDVEATNLENAWGVIQAGWQGDSVLENFEYHSHFIEQLLQLMMRLARYIERPVASDFVGLEGKSSSAEMSKKRLSVNQVGLLVFVCNQLPALVESIAKIRGLATLATSRGQLGELEASKLKYFMQGTRVQHEKVRSQADRLLEVTRDQMSSLPLIKAYEFKLMFLLSTVEKEVMESASIHMNSRQLFDLATEIIDVYLQVVDEGLSLLYQWQEEALENWFQYGG